MTPQEKANKLIDKVSSYSDYETMNDLYPKKQLALIAVDEIIHNIKWLEDSINYDKAIVFWKEVKQVLKTM